MRASSDSLQKYGFPAVWKGKNLESLQKCGPKMDCELLPDFPNLCNNSVGQRDCNAGRSEKNGEEDRN